MQDTDDVLTFRRQQAALIATFRTAHLNDYRQNDRLRQQLTQATRDGEFRCLVLDGTGLLYVISEVFGILIQLQKELRGQGRRLALCSLEPEVAELFELNQLHRALPIYKTVEEALAGA